MNASSLRPLWRRPFQAFSRTTLRQPVTRKYASTTAEAQPSIFQRLWDSPVGVKTVHFWAPVMKWAIVLAGVSDFARPAEKLSLAQNISLTATGIIWTRWCLIIKPKNYFLATVNFFLGMVGIVQVTRIGLYRRSLSESPEKQIEATKDKTKEVINSVAS